MSAQNGIKMLQLLAYIVLFWVVMPALLFGLGKLIASYTTDQPRSVGVGSQPETRPALARSGSD